MNPITAEQAILDSFKAALAAAFPSRFVTRSLKDFAERRPQEIKAGIFTILANGTTGEQYYQTLKTLVVGQIELDERASGEEIEQAELQMAREVRTLIQRKLRGPDMRVTGMDQSAQLEVPFGWVSLAIEAGPYDATEPLTADEPTAKLTDFLTFRADLDIAQPHQGAAEHAKWAQDAPDYSTSQPDAQLLVQIPRSDG